jgi:FlaA1/EpsC-like NDP-sugar epimerase
MGALFQLILVLGIRFAYRFVELLTKASEASKKNGDRIMIIGAGENGSALIRDVNKSREYNGKVVCFIDDNPNKWNRYIEGVPVVGDRNDILLNVKKYDVNKIYLAIPSATRQQRRDILNICKETDCELKNIPGMYQFVNDEVTVNDLKDVDIEDLLGRDPVRMNMGEVFDGIRNKVVLVTGGGGSIGSELCRQVAAHDPKQLIIFDVYENTTYEIQLELREKYPTMDLVVLIGSVRDSRKMYEVFSTYHPDIVYHAAAHKHVPLMENSPCEAIKNNVLGTYNTAYAAMACRCEKFILISTDKAVNPTNIMGASKRMCEMVIQCFDEKIRNGRQEDLFRLLDRQGWYGSLYDEEEAADLKNICTEFAAVRFGNVLGSHGSVIPIFKKQIEHGGPVTVTHPDIIRYFMTIPEAVSLVLQAGVYAKGGEIFILDMGEPVKIDTLARNLIKLSGLKPDEDIQIVYTGLRPGEKLYEEKLMDKEGNNKTDNDMIYVGKPLEIDEDRFLEQLKNLYHAANDNDENIFRLVEETVDTYKRNEAES